MSWGMLAIITIGIRVLGQWRPPIISVFAFASPRVARQTGEPVLIWEMPCSRRTIQTRMAISQLQRY
jgi:hypothetical protein